MISKIKIIYSSLMNRKQNYFNRFNMHIIRTKIRRKEVSNVLKGRNLILIPHADDEWVGCSQIIEKNRNNTILCNMNRQGNDSFELHEKRYNELRKLANRFNITILNNKSNIEYASFLVSVIEENHIENIFLPFFVDWHEDHISVMIILYEALNKLRNKNLSIYMYQVSVPISEEFITHFSEMNKIEHNSKWQFFGDVYKTQKFFPIDRFKCNERINGKICGVYAAEVYSQMNITEWMFYFNKLIPNKQMRMNIIKNFRDIKKIRVFLESYYSEVSNYK